MKQLKIFFLITDLGFIGYWLATFFHLFPTQYLYSEYQNPIVVAWNWSFLPLDLLISATGLTSLYLFSRGRREWHSVAFISLLMTCCSGLQALAFWGVRREFDLQWWLINGYLMLYPLFFLPQFIKRNNSYKGSIPSCKN